MSMKLALLLALQVCVSLPVDAHFSLGKLPKPDPELEKKQIELLTELLQRLEPGFKLLEDTLELYLTPVTESHLGQEARKLMENLTKLGEDLLAETGVRDYILVMAIQSMFLLEKVDQVALVVYGDYIRPWAGPYIEQSIGKIRTVLDTVMPVPEQYHPNPSPSASLGN
ncbi:apolipoprotein A-II [Amia ocellicauda]|uniref:apolipoprotein A-II n=1 Tax=Amia ocellicauda TaxID=2972642 RepID=UPI003464D028